MKKHFITSCLSVLLIIGGCKDPQTTIEPKTLDESFGAYWFKGKAEITSFALHQARYGEIREGQAVQIFVTEPFSATSQVKLDEPDKAGTDRVDVLKMNFMRHFQTGIYPYSVMTSAFTPIGSVQPMKLTGSVQEWCGQTFTQMNLREGRWHLSGYSYFQQEGDQDLQLQGQFAEDGIWNAIRVGQTAELVGERLAIPPVTWCMMLHRELKPYPALVSVAHNADTVRLTLNYLTIQRKVEIVFFEDFPHRIIGWTEEYVDGNSPDAKLLTTRATAIRTYMTDYWNENSAADGHLHPWLFSPVDGGDIP